MPDSGDGNPVGDGERGTPSPDSAEAAPAADRAYAGRSGAERKAERRDKIIDTALELLDREGLRALTVRRICQDAGLNNRYFYESFASLDDLLDTIVLRVERQIVERFATAAATQLRGRSGVEWVRTAMAIMAGAFLDDPRLLRALRFSGDAQLGARRDELLSRSAAAIRPYVDSDVASYLLIGGWSDVLWAWHTQRIGGTRDELVDTLTDLFRRVRKPRA